MKRGSWLVAGGWCLAAAFLAGCEPLGSIRLDAEGNCTGRAYSNNGWNVTVKSEREPNVIRCIVEAKK
jgi:hypothetical protein